MTVLPEGPAGPATDPVASACFRLGWRVEELFSQFAVPEGVPRTYDLAKLPGLSELTSYDRQRLGLDQADFVVSQVIAKVGTPAGVALDLTADARAKLDSSAADSDRAGSRRNAYRLALCDLHVNLLVTLTAANSSYGKAYGLGRALADTTRPNQAADQLTASFERDRIGQLRVWLDELTSLLPDHAAMAVAMSLTWWQQAVAAAPADREQGQKMPAGQAPLQRKPAVTPAPRQHGTGTGLAGPPSIDSLAAAVTRQGALWRGVLDGDKLCTDLLTPPEYLRAGERLARHYASLVRQTLRSMPWLLAVLLLLLAAAVLVLAVIPGSAVARTATAIAAIAGTLSAIWKLIRTRVEPIAAQLEKPLWGTELNTAVAEAVTCLPAGTPQDPKPNSSPPTT
jgi:hypothetical protein